MRSPLRACVWLLFRHNELTRSVLMERGTRSRESHEEAGEGVQAACERVTTAWARRRTQERDSVSRREL